MFLTNKERNLSDEEWELITDVHREQYKLYLEEFIMPEILAHYIATGYYKHSVYEESFNLHIRTNLNIVNYKLLLICFLFLYLSLRFKFFYRALYHLF